MALKVMGARVVLKRDDVKQTTESGIILPEKTAEENRAKAGVVVAVGDGMRVDDVRRIPMTVKVGDRVIYREFAGVEVQDNGEEFVIINEGDILAIVS